MQHSKSAFIFLAIEDVDTQSILKDLLTLDGLAKEQVAICQAETEKKKFKNFNLIADLYIWTSKYWYGTYFEKLTYVRLRGVEQLPLMFLMKYGNKIRLGIRSRFAYIVKEKDCDYLKKTWQKSHRNFDQKRLNDISPSMINLEKNWDLLISNGNPSFSSKEKK
jgi:hypothetical protein